MNRVVPLHALVLVIHPDHRASVSEAKRLFPAHEVIDPDGVIADLVGQTDRPDLSAIAMAEMRHRVSLKLSLGERVVLAAPAFHRRENRLIFAKIAETQGASVVYLLSSTATDKALLTGDGFAHVSQTTQMMHIAKPLPSNPLSTLRSRFRGITVVGDVHGCLKTLQDALSWARSRRHFTWFLGDVIDCGPESTEVMTLVYHMVMRAEGALMLGNHERKIARWITQQDTRDARFVRLSEGNRVTIDALARMSGEQRLQWCGQFRSLLGRAALITHVGNVTFAHAAIHPDVWAGHRDHQGIEDYALYGEPNPATTDFSLSYRWVDAVPNDNIVFVGHDRRSTQAPLVVTGAKGGRVIFLDTGSGKGGFLSTADLRFTEEGGLHLENFNRY